MLVVAVSSCGGVLAVMAGSAMLTCSLDKRGLFGSPSMVPPPADGGTAFRMNAASR